MPIPEAGLVFHKKVMNNVTWIVNLSSLISDMVDLVICYPDPAASKVSSGKGEKITYYEIPRSSKAGTVYDNKSKKYFEEVINEVRPDCIHIWGTEFPHTLSCVQAAEELGVVDKIVVSIQGLVSIYSQHFLAGVPQNIIKKYSLRDFLKQLNLNQQKKSFEKRGIYEKQTIQKVKHVIGRTDWDRACVEMYNPCVKYHFNNETLRQIFYDKKWDYDNCEKHSIFMSQGGYPIKGMHYMLKALQIVKKQFPDAKLYVTGKSFLSFSNWKEWVKRDYFSIFLKKCAKKYNLEDSIIFLGQLNAEEMCQQYLKANVYVLASTIENSPNSLGEAMLVGTPIVASDVGGVRNLLKDKEEGYMYPADEPYMLAYYIKEIFKQKKNIESMTSVAQRHARDTHDAKKNMHDLLEIYKEISDLQKRMER